MKLSFCAALAALAYSVMAEDAHEKRDQVGIKKDAPQQPNQPSDILISGFFYSFGKRVVGSAAFWADDGWTKASIRLIGFPPDGGPYNYSIETDPLPKDNVCSESGKILNPYEATPDGTTWEKMAIGDLSGKHGQVNTPYYHKTYEDPYLSLERIDPREQGPDESYIGNHSFVINDKNGTYLGCCNLKRSRRSGRMVDFDGDKIPEEFFVMLQQANETDTVDLPLAMGRRAMEV